MRLEKNSESPDLGKWAVKEPQDPAPLTITVGKNPSGALFSRRSRRDDQQPSCSARMRRGGLRRAVLLAVQCLVPQPPRAKDATGRLDLDLTPVLSARAEPECAARSLNNRAAGTFVWIMHKLSSRTCDDGPTLRLLWSLNCKPARPELPVLIVSLACTPLPAESVPATLPDAPRC
jgi:hypothetical protein